MDVALTSAPSIHRGLLVGSYCTDMPHSDPDPMKEARARCRLLGLRQPLEDCTNRIVESCIQEEVKVALCTRNREQLDQAGRELDSEVLAAQADMTQVADIKKPFAATADGSAPSIFWSITPGGRT